MSGTFLPKGVMYQGAESTRETIPSTRSATLKAGTPLISNVPVNSEQKVLDDDSPVGDHISSIAK